jgi:hypothetical protein
MSRYRSVPGGSASGLGEVIRWPVPRYQTALYNGCTVDVHVLSLLAHCYVPACVFFPPECTILKGCMMAFRERGVGTDFDCGCDVRGDGLVFSVGE